MIDQIFVHSDNFFINKVYQISSAPFSVRCSNLCVIVYLMGQEGYKGKYDGQGEEDSWTRPEDMNKNPRKRIVADAVESFHRPISVLDIGTGMGRNTRWIAETGDGSNWSGVDTESTEEDLEISKGDEHLSFYHGDFLDSEWREQNTELQKERDLIVDQGAILTELEGDDLKNYLELIHKRLSDGGKFVTALMLGESGRVVYFKDGRKRVLYQPEDLKKPPFSDYFEVDDKSLENPLAHADSLLPESEDMPYIKNPLGAKKGDKLQVTVFHTILNKNVEN